MQSTANPAQRLLSVREAADYLGVSVSWLNKQRLIGGFVPYVKIGRRVGYDLADLYVAIQKAKRSSTSQP